jgi:hypothetical protein
MERLAAYPPAVGGAQPQTMTHFLALLRERHGSIEGLARQLGVEDGVLTAIRANLLAPA